VHLLKVHLLKVHLLKVHLIKVHLLKVHLIKVHLLKVHLLTELGPPIAYVVDPQNLMATELEDAADRISDDGLVRRRFF
jgi:hypothetical protein